MKYSLLWIFIAWMLVSCNDFLEESSQDEVRPTTVEDLMQVMIGEAYPMETKFSRFLDHLTDDMECNGISRGRDLGSWVGKCTSRFFLERGYV